MENNSHARVRRAELAPLAVAPLAVAPRTSSVGSNEVEDIDEGIVTFDMSDFRLLGDLGIGSHGSVSVAVHRETGSVVAAKRLHPTSQGFWYETKLAAACSGNYGVIDHFGTARDHASGKLFMLMELGGIPLRKSIRMSQIYGSPFTKAEVFAIMEPLVNGLKHIHGKGIVHGDIKPDNILVGVSSEGKLNAKLCDFGNAMYSDEAIATWNGMPHGTYGYMAPEVLNAERCCSPASDMWSLGCVMFELATGRALLREHRPLPQIGELRKLFRLPGGGTSAGPAAPEASAGEEAGPAATGPGGGVHAAPVEQPESPRRSLRDEFLASDLSEASFDVLDGLLQPDPTRRLTATAALQEAWFVSGGKA